MTPKTIHDYVDIELPDFSGFPDITDIGALKQEHAKQLAALKLAHENISGKLASEKAYARRCDSAYKECSLERDACQSKLFAVQAAPWRQRLVYLVTRRLPK